MSSRRKHCIRPRALWPLVNTRGWRERVAWDSSKRVEVQPAVGGRWKRGSKGHRGREGGEVVGGCTGGTRRAWEHGKCWRMEMQSGECRGGWRDGRIHGWRDGAALEMKTGHSSGSRALDTRPRVFAHQMLPLLASRTPLGYRPWPGPVASPPPPVPGHSAISPHVAGLEPGPVREAAAEARVSPQGRGCANARPRLRHNSTPWSAAIHLLALPSRHLSSPST